jgi:signal transduction histidine kinase
VLGVESEDWQAFDEDDLHTLEGLAELAAIVIRNAQQYDDLSRTKGLVGARTALAWMGMASNVWRHTITTQATTINGRVKVLRRRQAAGAPPETLASDLAEIETLSQAILDKPITPPLSPDDGVALVGLNGLINERLNQLRANPAYGAVQLGVAFEAPDVATVRTSREWLRRALDVLIDNAVDELKHVELERRRIVVKTRERDGLIHIVVCDQGRGITKAVADQLFKGKVRKQDEQTGLGMGLLMAQAIVETYGGRIVLEKSDGLGTDMALYLPSGR